MLGFAPIAGAALADPIPVKDVSVAVQALRLPLLLVQ